MNEAIEELKLAGEQISALKNEIGKVIVGQENVVEQAMWCLLAEGHALLEGIPGLGKTMLVRTIADAMSLAFSRIQFTPDLMPADITGTTIIDFTSNTQRFGKGPVFGNLILADEINRATPKTQSALLEAMQEGTVTAGGQTHQLPKPFFVLATQNPIEQEGTYPLPEAQLDRFLIKIGIDYPSAEELKEIVRRTTGNIKPRAEKQMSLEQLKSLQIFARDIIVSDEMLDYIVALVLMTQPHNDQALEAVKPWLRYGAGPRAVQALVAVSRVRALMSGRLHVAWTDIAAVALPVLRHRIGLSYEAIAQGITADACIVQMLQALEQKRSR